MTREALRLVVAEVRRQCALGNVEATVARREACAGVKTEANGM
jgi:hypothetical protein